MDNVLLVSLIALGFVFLCFCVALAIGIPRAVKKQKEIRRLKQLIEADEKEEKSLIESSEIASSVPEDSFANNDYENVGLNYGANKQMMVPEENSSPDEMNNVPRSENTQYIPPQPSVYQPLPSYPMRATPTVHYNYPYQQTHQFPRYGSVGPRVHNNPTRSFQQPIPRQNYQPAPGRPWQMPTRRVQQPVQRSNYPRP